MAWPLATGIVTPEAVVLQMDTAGIGSRLLARVLDTIFQAAIIIPVLLAATVLAATVARVGIAGVFVALFLVGFGYPIGFETLWRGRTPGKAILGIRVMTVEGAPIRFRHAAIRAVLGLVEIYLFEGAPALITMGLSARNQRLGDMVAGTLVLRERVGGRPLAPVSFGVPPGYEQYVASMDVSRVTAQEYAAARSFLLRAGELAPERRLELAWRLGRPLAARLGRPPPEWVGPEAFLACLAAAYQERSRRAAPAAWYPVVADYGAAAMVGPAAPWVGPAPARVPVPEGPTEGRVPVGEGRAPAPPSDGFVAPS